VNIKLIQSGGIAGKKMTAVADAKLTEKEWESLVASLAKKAGSGKMRDAFHYSIQQEGNDASKATIDIHAIPDEHEAMFKKLFDNLSPEH
jgi:translation initiation factor 1 (eIF-1/SUI1)